MGGDESQFLFNKRLLIVDIDVSSQLQDVGCFLFVLEFDFQLFIDVAEPLDP